MANGDSTAGFDGSDGDGAFALNAGDGDDKVFGADATRQLVIFGGAGNDNIATGSSDDIVFGDLGRVDYTKKITVDGVEYDAVVTRLGHSVPQNPVNPHVTFATDNTISDGEILGTPFEFPTDYEGLVGLSVQVISPEGHVQFRTVIANTADTITVDAPWGEFPAYDEADPDDNYYYRISSYPDDQTDGLFRGPRVIWSVKDEIGGDDTIHAGGGGDVVIGGAGDDPMLDGGADADYVLGDDARFDFLPVDGSEDGATRLLRITDPGAIGDDTLAGGADIDLLIGGLGDDDISGEGNDDLLIGDDATVLFDVDGVAIISIETTNRTEGGIDTMYGGADDDIVIGGTNGDNLDGGSGEDLLFGDNVRLVLNEDSGDAITPRFRTPGGATLYDAIGNPLVGGRAAVPGAARPGRTDLTLDQAWSSAISATTTSRRRRLISASARRRSGDGSIDP
jgi:Ca2+-binding RTX toxin-like protein